MSLWWLEPGWTDACCMSCGANIHASGGDPDWGYCLPCFGQIFAEQQQERELEKRLAEMEERHFAEMKAHQ